MASKILPYRDAKREFEKQYCKEVLEICGGNIGLAARISQYDRRGFYDLLHRTGVRLKGSTRPGPKPKKGIE